MINPTGVDQLNLANTLWPLILGQHPDIGGDARVVEKIGRQGDDGLDQVMIQQPAADLAFTGSCTTGKQRRTVLNDGAAAKGVVHLIHGGLKEQHLSVALCPASQRPSARVHPSGIQQ